jgi:hypothetical protein
MSILADITKLRAQLACQKDLGTPIKDDLYSHLQEVFNRIMLHHQSDAFQRFEHISYLVKQNNFKIADPRPADEVN